MEARAASDLADWLVYLELEGKADRTLYAYHREVARLLRRYPLLELKEFTHNHLNDELRKVPPRSRHISRSIWNKWFEWALLDGRLTHNPMFRVAKVKHPTHRTRSIFTAPEIALLEALPAPDGQLFAILFGTGLRKGEARRLQRWHVDLDRRRVNVYRGKGDKDRVIAPTPQALQAVADLTITEGLNGTDHLWASKPGGGQVTKRRDPVGETTFSRWYANCIKQAGVTYRSPHTTRHTYHELMRLAGLTLEERQLLMGHASIRTTADQYGHLDFDAVAAKLADFRLENV